MNVLIVAQSRELSRIWGRHIERLGGAVRIEHSQESAVAALRYGAFDILVIDLVLTRGSAFAVADYASYRNPEVRLVFVTNTSFFSDGSIFQHMPNACALVRAATPPADIAAIVEHYGAH